MLAGRKKIDELVEETHVSENVLNLHRGTFEVGSMLYLCQIISLDQLAY